MSAGSPGPCLTLQSSPRHLNRGGDVRPSLGARDTHAATTGRAFATVGTPWDSRHHRIGRGPVAPTRLVSHRRPTSFAIWIRDGDEFGNATRRAPVGVVASDDAGSFAVRTERRSMFRRSVPSIGRAIQTLRWESVRRQGVRSIRGLACANGNVAPRFGFATWCGESMRIAVGSSCDRMIFAATLTATGQYFPHGNSSDVAPISPTSRTLLLAGVGYRTRRRFACRPGMVVAFRNRSAASSRDTRNDW